jgi:hypothetical protein
MTIGIGVVTVPKVRFAIAKYISRLQPSRETQIVTVSGEPDDQDVLEISRGSSVAIVVPLRNCVEEKLKKALRVRPDGYATH